MRWFTQSIVGAGLLAMAESQTTSMLNDTTPSRAGSLPQGFVLYGNQQGSAPFVITGLGMDTTVIARLAIGMNAVIVADFTGPMNAMVVPGFIMGAAAS